MFRNPGRNIAMSLLGMLGLTHMFQMSIPPAARVADPMNRPRHGGSRWGRNVRTHVSRKDDFNRAVERAADLGIAVPTPLKVARKAHLGTLTLPGGRRGMQVKYERSASGKWQPRITA